MEKKAQKKMLIERKIQQPQEIKPSQGETSFSCEIKPSHVGEYETHERDPTIINDQQSCDGNDNGETSFSYDDTQLGLIGEDERDCGTLNNQHSPDANDNENQQEEDYTYDNDLSIGECLLGREVLDLDDALNLYKAHARALGFSVRKGTSRRRVKINDDNQIVSIFWRDSMMLEDYIAYGDALIFDTTYRINRYNLICAPFFGINNHWKTTMFACAFIFDEKTEIFEWLLETFKNSISGLVPKSIFTDQNIELTNAIAKVFPNSRHRLCIWHLQTNFISNFDMLRNNPTFMDIFNKCLTGCDNEEEFLRCWTEMISTYGLEESFGFSQLYKLRDKWCTALSKDFFTARILSSQKVEVINRAVSFGANQTTSLFEFYHIFEDTVKRWRNIEEIDNFKCSTERHPASESQCKLLKHAAEVYTLDLFDDFQKEFDMAMGSYIRAVANHGCSKMYEVSLNEDFTQSHNVQYDDEFLELSCTCMSYQECGLLCYHILRVMHMHCIFEIPKKYIMKRWTKLAKSEIWTKHKDDDDALTVEDKELQTPWRHTMARSFYNLLTTCQFNEHAKKVCEQGLNDLRNAVKPKFSNK